MTTTRISLSQYGTHAVRLAELPEPFARAPEQAAQVFHELVHVSRTLDGGAAEFSCRRTKVGAAEAFGVRVEVYPWVAWSEFYTFLCYAASAPVDPKQARMLTDLTRRASGLEDAIARMLLAEIDRICRIGLSRQYARRVRPCRFLRGRVLWTENFPWRGARAREVICRFHEMTFDNLDNQLLLAGLRCAVALARDRQTVQEGQDLLAVWEGLASDVAVAESDFDLARASYTRLTEHYRSGHALAKMLVLGYRPASPFDPGSDASPALIIDMAKLFERFAEAFVADALRGTGLQVVSQSEDRLALLDAEGAKYSSARPDMEIRYPDGRTCAVVDAKYKPYWAGNYPGRWPSRKISNDDIYQMLFYQKRIQLREGLSAPPAAIILAPLPMPDERSDASLPTVASRYRTVRFGNDPRSSILLLLVPVTAFLRQLAKGAVAAEAVGELDVGRELRGAVEQATWRRHRELSAAGWSAVDGGEGRG